MNALHETNLLIYGMDVVLCNTSAGMYVTLEVDYRKGIWCGIFPDIQGVVINKCFRVFP